MSNPLAALRQDALLEKTTENVMVPAGQSITLADLSGPGYISNLWMAIGGGSGPALDGHLHAYYDGASTPAFNTDIGGLAGTHWGADGSFGCRHMYASIDGKSYDTSFLMSFPMPFGQHARIEYHNTSSVTAQVFAEIDYSLTAADVPGALRLKSQAHPYVGGVLTRQITDDTTLVDIPSGGGPGWLVYLTTIGGIDAATLTPNGPNSMSWLESNYAFVVDGVTTVESSGGEDFPRSGWYFSGNRFKDMSLSSAAFVGTDRPTAQPNCVAFGVDLLELWGGLPFQSTLRVHTPPEPARVTADRLCGVVLYYQAGT